MVKYLGPGALDYALVNNNRAVERAIGPGVPVEAVVAEGLESVACDVTILAGDVVNEANLLRHDPVKLATMLHDLVTGAALPESATTGAEASALPITTG